MEHEQTDIECTVQGGDTPVPVRDLSGRAGSPGPSACDRSALPVGNQAGSGYKATGKEEGRKKISSALDRFIVPRERANSLPDFILARTKLPLPWEVDDEQVKRSPKLKNDGGKKRKGEGNPTQEDLDDPERAGLNRSYVSLMWDEESGRSVKKPKEGKSLEPRSRKTSQSLSSKIIRLVEVLDKDVRLLSKITKESKNTRVDIKDLAEKISSEVSQLCTKEILNTIEGIDVSREIIVRDATEDAGTQTEGVDMSGRKEVAVQTEREPWQVRNEATVDGIRKAITKDRCYAGFKRQLDIEWPPEVYVNTKVLAGNPIWENNEGDVAIYTGKRDNLDKGVGRQFLRKFPEVVDLAQGDQRDPIHLITYEVKVDIGGERLRSSRSASVITVEDDEEKEYETIKKWKEKMKEEGIRRVAVVFMDADILTRRKLLEYVFWGEEIKVLLYEMERKTKSRKPEKARQEVPQRKATGPQKRAEAVIVSAEGKSYADLLRIVKGKIDATAIGVGIQAVRKTRTGDLLLTIDGGPDKTKILKSEIQSRCREDGIRIRGGRRDETVLHIKGIDPTTSKEEIEREILSAIGDDGEAVLLKSLRPAYGGNNNITVTMPKNVGERLMAKGNLRLGWSSCKVSERVEVRKCFRCWGIGHRINECNGPDRRSLCLRCGRASHKAIDCRETPRCPICNVEGHRADSMMCPVFRNEIHRTRDRKETERTRRGSTEMEARGDSSQGGHLGSPRRTKNPGGSRTVRDTDRHEAEEKKNGQDKGSTPAQRESVVPHGEFAVLDEPVDTGEVASSEGTTAMDLGVASNTVASATVSQEVPLAP